MLWFDYLNLALLVIAAAAAFIIRKRPASFRFLFAYFLITLLFEITSTILIAQGQNNLFLYHLSTPIQLFFLGLFFLEEGIALNRKTARLLLLALCSVTILMGFALNKWNQYFSFASLIKNFCVALFSMLYLKQVFEKKEVEKILRNKTFLTTCILLFASLGNFLIEGTMNYFMEGSPEIAATLFYFRVGLELAFNSAFIIIALQKSSR